MPTAIAAVVPSLTSKPEVVWPFDNDDAEQIRGKGANPL